MQTGLKQIHDWAADLEVFSERIAPRFGRIGVRYRAIGFLRGRLRAGERKNGWQLAEQAGGPPGDGMPRLLNHARWDADQVRDPSLGQAYYQRKLAQAKTPEEARRSLKRHLANVVYRHLITDDHHRTRAC